VILIALVSIRINGTSLSTGGGEWTTFTPSTVKNDIYHSDTNSQSGTVYANGSLVTITGAIGEGSIGEKMGLIVEHCNRTQSIGIGYNTISQVGSNPDLILKIKSKGNGLVYIGNNIATPFAVSQTSVYIGTSSIYQNAMLSINVADKGTMLSSPDISQFLWRINSTINWGIYWSTNASGNNYYISTDSDPNEIVFVGNNTSVASVDLDDGSFYSKGWFKSVGNGGWYSQNYGGGWYMSDSTWIRSYGNKQVWVDNILACNGNLGAGTSGPAAKLHVNEITGTTHGANQGSIIIDHDNNGGASSIVFRSKVNRGSDYGYIQYQDTSSVGGGGESALMILGISNDADDHVILAPSGNVGVSNYSPADKFHVSGNILASGNITAYYSDIRLKNVSEYVTNVLTTLDNISVFKYKCNDLAVSFGYDNF